MENKRITIETIINQPKEVFSSDLRKNLGEALDKIYETKVPLAVKKKIAGGTKDFIFVSKIIYTMLIYETHLVQNENNNNTN